jgi:phage shock protein A
LVNIFSRAANIAQARINKLLDAVEDPNASLDLSYEKMLTALQEVKHHLADVVTEQKSLENQINTATKEAAAHEEDARTALKMNREDLAEAALTRKQNSLARVAQLQDAANRINEQVDRLKDASQKYQDRLDSFKVQKEVTKANYSAAKAEVHISESLSGISKQIGNVGGSIQRAEDKTERMMARASAMESLANEGILNDPFDTRDKTARELDQLKRDAAIQDDLERMKREIAGE